jgi:hypothetical protein
MSTLKPPQETPKTPKTLRRIPMGNLKPILWNAELEGKVYGITFMALDWLDATAQAERIRQHPQRHNHEWLKACALYSKTDPKIFSQMLRNP